VQGGAIPRPYLPIAGVRVRDLQPVQYACGLYLQPAQYGTQYDNFIPNSMRRLPPLKICGLRNVPAGTLVRLVKP